MHLSNMNIIKSTVVYFYVIKMSHTFVVFFYLYPSIIFIGHCSRSAVQLLSVKKSEFSLSISELF